MTTVLVVEDEPSILSMVTDYLEGEGFQVLTAQDGYVAISMLGKNAIDVVLADVGLPGALGTSIAMRAMKYDPPPAIVLMSGYDYALPDSMKMDGVSVIRKPVSLDEIGRAIRNKLSGEKLSPPTTQEQQP